jgi:hypothetical protein
MLIFPSSYFAPIAQYHLIRKHQKFVIDGKEHFVKRSNRNRCTILGANGPLQLSIPLKKYSHTDKTEDIRISYEEDWQSLHWKSIQAAYSNSAYFEFYEDEFKEFFENKPTDVLMEFNEFLEDRILQLIEVDVEKERASSYKEQEPNWRTLLEKQNQKLIENSFFPHYQQVFTEAGEFHPNLSIIDLLFNLGPASRRYLAEVKLAPV